MQDYTARELIAAIDAMRTEYRELLELGETVITRAQLARLNELQWALDITPKMVEAKLRELVNKMEDTHA